LKPDVVLLDVRMPQGGGVSAAATIRKDSPHSRLIALSAYEDQATTDAMRKAGVEHYLVKGESPSEILRAILGEAEAVEDDQ
ncbi:MAG: response regulator, partial [Actinobacteria bacterium]|nr:response regulator [Actinomycetota bacterium]